MMHDPDNMTQNKTAERRFLCRAICTMNHAVRYRRELHSRIEVLQTSALLLGYGTIQNK